MSHTAPKATLVRKGYPHSSPHPIKTPLLPSPPFPGLPANEPGWPAKQSPARWPESAHSDEQHWVGAEAGALSWEGALALGMEIGNTWGRMGHGDRLQPSSSEPLASHTKQQSPPGLAR